MQAQTEVRNSSVDFSEILHLAAQGMRFVPTTAGMTRSDFKDSPDIATDDPAQLKCWVEDGLSLVTMARLDGTYAIDIDDLGKCEALGMPDPGALYWVKSASSNGTRKRCHGHGLHDETTLGFGCNLIRVPDPDDIEKAKAEKRQPNYILELKLNRHSVAAPTAHRFGQKGKNDGVYAPFEPGATMARGITSEFKEWIDKYGVKSGSTTPASGGEPEFHEDFDFGELLGFFDCSEAKQGMVNGLLHVVPESCAECGRPPGTSTVAAAKCKFMFGDGWGYRCHMCGATREDLETKFGKWKGVMFARDHDFAAQAAALLNDEDEPQDHADPSRRTDKLPRIYPLTDMGNAERFECRFGGEFASTKETGWLAYRNGVWREDKTGEADRAMQLTIRLITQEAELVEGDGDTADGLRDAIIGWAKTSESNSKVKAALERASMLKGFAKDYAFFEKSRGLLHCANGTLELDTGTFREHDPNDLLTKAGGANYDPEAKRPGWEKFITEATGGNAELAGFLQRAAGYTLSAETSEHAAFLPYGPGGTGKSTFLNVLKGILGDYAKTADPEMFMTKKGDSGQPFDMAGFEGVRALLAAETEEGKRLATAKLKRMTGQDTVRACRKFRDSYEFVPVWKVWLAFNDRPRAAAGDDAWWDRAKLIPFTVKFRGTEAEVKDLAAKLLTEESSGILNWMLEGYRMWKVQGLGTPEAVKRATEEWRDSEDWLARFLEERTEKASSPTEFVTRPELYKAFTRWADDTKEAKGITDKRFCEEMRKKGYRDERVKRDGKAVRVWPDVKLVSSLSRFPPQINPDEVL